MKNRGVKVKTSFRGGHRSLAFSRWLLLLGAVASLFLLVSVASADTGKYSDQRNARWLEAIDFFARELPDRHVDLFFQLSEAEFRERVDSLRAAVPELADYEIAVSLIKIAAAVGDSHTSVNADQTGFFNRLPVRMRWFTDGLYVVEAAPGYSRALGKRVDGIEGRPIDEVNQRIRAVLSLDNEAQLLQRGPRSMTIPEVLAALGIAATPDSVVYNMQDASDLVLHPVGMMSMPEMISVVDSLGCAPPLHMQNPDTLYWYRYIEDAEALYARYAACREMEGRPFAEFAEEVLSFLDSRDVDRFIFDVRANPGGNSAIARPLVDGVESRGKINRDGGVFLLIDRGTYSSALLNALDFQNSTRAIFVGEPTGGKPNHYGEVRLFMLPNTYVAVTHSTKYFSTSRIDTPSLNPDIYAGQSFRSFLECGDPALEAALDYPGPGD